MVCYGCLENIENQMAHIDGCLSDMYFSRNAYKDKTTVKRIIPNTRSYLRGCLDKDEDIKDYELIYVCEIEDHIFKCLIFNPKFYSFQIRTITDILVRKGTFSLSNKFIILNYQWVGPDEIYKEKDVIIKKLNI
tara:strand:- start:3431 stop:3832 length:402 start_codon:yes stop_codon:yes gene_type:complete